jgi:hypothetical protein
MRYHCAKGADVIRHIQTNFLHYNLCIEHIDPLYLSLLSLSTLSNEVIRFWVVSLFFTESGILLLRKKILKPGKKTDSRIFSTVYIKFNRNSKTIIVQNICLWDYGFIIPE